MVDLLSSYIFRVKDECTRDEMEAKKSVGGGGGVENAKTTALALLVNCQSSRQLQVSSFTGV